MPRQHCKLCRNAARYTNSPTIGLAEVVYDMSLKSPCTCAKQHKGIADATERILLRLRATLNRRNDP